MFSDTGNRETATESLGYAPPRSVSTDNNVSSYQTDRPTGTPAITNTPDTATTATRALYNGEYIPTRDKPDYGWTTDNNVSSYETDTGKPTITNTPDTATTATRALHDGDYIPTRDEPDDGWTTDKNVSSYEKDTGKSTITNTPDTATTATQSLYNGDYIPTRDEPGDGWTTENNLSSFETDTRAPTITDKPETAATATQSLYDGDYIPTRDEPDDGWTTYKNVSSYEKDTGKSTITNTPNTEATVTPSLYNVDYIPPMDEPGDGWTTDNNVSSYETDTGTPTITNTPDTAATATPSLYNGDYIPTRDEPDDGWTTDKNVSSYEKDTGKSTITNTPDTEATATPSLYIGDYIPTRDEPDDDLTRLGVLELIEEEFYEIICNTTCEQKCGDRLPQGAAMCYCDWACVRLGDCCLDYEAACLSGPNVTVNNYADVLRNRTSPSATCDIFLEESRINETNFVSLLVVTSCGRRDTNSLMIDLCESPPVGNKTLATELPVIFRDVIYRNRYCALCNNPGEVLTDIVTAGAAIQCENTTEFTYWRRYDGDTGDDVDISNCGIMLNLSNFQNQPIGTSRYECMWDTSVVTTCDAYLSFPMLDFDYLELTCHKYRAYISKRIWGPIYNNPHCAMCNGVIDINGMQCGVYEPQYDPPSFRRLISFEYLDRRLIICPRDSVIDHTTGHCVKPTCPAGHVMLRDKVCTALDVRVPQIFSATGDIRIYFVIASEYQFSQDYYEELVSDIGIEIVVGSFKVNTCDNFTVLDNWDEIMPINSTCWIQETMSRKLSEVVSRVELFEAQIRLQSLPYYNKLGINMSVFSQDVNDTSSMPTCLRGSPKIRHDLVLLGDMFSQETFPSTFQVMSTSQEYNVSEVPILVSWRNSNLTDIGWNESVTAIVCEADIMSCDTVTFQADEYIEKGESIIIYDGTQQEVKILERYVLRLDSNAIVFCSSLLSNLTGVLYSDNTDSLVEGILSVIGGTLSMVCIVLTMITYCMFEQIRTRAGKCVMNLCVALFFAQLSFHVSDTFVSYHEACAAMAVLQHYFWLVAFLWMNVLAFDISCTFADLKPSNVDSDSARLRLFALYAWGLPAVLVAVCLVLDLSSSLPFSYGSSTMCWIAGPRAVVYYFATPLALIITANAVLFVRTIVGLRRALTIADKARQPLQQRKTFVIYVRLTSLMGFTWLFGFLANIDGLSFLWYLFILCNTCQGVFIGLSFALTPTVRRHWRDWFKAKQTRNTSSFSTASPSTTSTFVKVETRM